MAVRQAIFTQATTLGVRENRVVKQTLDREVRMVAVDGRPVRVKIGRLPDGTVVTAQPEGDDVARVAIDLAHPVKVVLAGTRRDPHRLPRGATGPAYRSGRIG